jgi:hypothetical protein
MQVDFVGQQLVQYIEILQWCGTFRLGAQRRVRWVVNLWSEFNPTLKRPELRGLATAMLVAIGSYLPHGRREGTAANDASNISFANYCGCKGSAFEACCPVPHRKRKLETLLLQAVNL